MSTSQGSISPTRASQVSWRVFLLALVASLSLAACSNSDDSARRAPSSMDVPQVKPITPFPRDARVITESELSDQDEKTCDPLPSLRPDSRSAAERVPQILARGRLVVGVDLGSNLWSFRDPVSGSLTGFDVQLASEIARDIFDDPTHVEYRALTSDERLKALETGQVDIVVKSMSITCKRRERITFSAPYFRAYQRVLAVKDSGIGQISDLAGKRVCVVTGTSSLKRIVALAPNITLLSVNSWADCLVALQQRQADAISTDDAILVGITKQDPYLSLVGSRLGVEPYGVGVAASTPEHNTDGLVRQVNTTLERIKQDGTWNEMYDQWLLPLGPNPGPPIAHYNNEPTS